MRKQSARRQESSTKIVWALTFLGLLVVVIICSFLWKFAMFLQTSRFDGAHQFTIIATGKSGEVISFNPDQQNITDVKIGNDTTKLLGQQLEVPVDGEIPQGISGISGMLFASLIHHSATISPVDIIKLLWFITTVPKDSINTVNLSSDSQQLSFLIPKLFQDKTLYMEGKSITIVNATGISGFGSRLAKLLTNIGANVIMVSTADIDSPHSAISYTGEKSYTISRLEKILHISSQNSSNNSLSDITITIGKDLEKTEIF